MQNSDDPRNIFYNQRQEYNQPRKQNPSETFGGSTQSDARNTQGYGQNGSQYDGQGAQAYGQNGGQTTQNGGSRYTQGGTQRTQGYGQNSQQSQQTGGTGGTQSDYEKKLAEMKRLAAKYEREGEGQLVKDIVNNVLEQKAAGKLSNEQLIAFAKRVSPLLNAEQRGRLNGLLEQLLKL